MLGEGYIEDAALFSTAFDRRNAYGPVTPSGTWEIGRGDRQNAETSCFSLRTVHNTRRWPQRPRCRLSVFFCWWLSPCLGRRWHWPAPRLSLLADEAPMTRLEVLPAFEALLRQPCRLTATRCLLPFSFSSSPCALRNETSTAQSPSRTFSLPCFYCFFFGPKTRGHPAACPLLDMYQRTGSTRFVMSCPLSFSNS